MILMLDLPNPAWCLLIPSHPLQCTMLLDMPRLLFSTVDRSPRLLLPPATSRCTKRLEPPTGTGSLGGHREMPSGTRDTKSEPICFRKLQLSSLPVIHLRRTMEGYLHHTRGWRSHTLRRAKFPTSTASELSSKLRLPRQGRLKRCSLSRRR